ncbi:hypothetical protein BD749_2495 [Pontibacter ramchanderi]|uniref:Uncharacterized protein n=1 Tax=Pontibacter ramchanderi TaxID=1179743 RepID=A0A2N3UDB4_9BACT|nr:hypothetical protein BD749_2495 [Pontibacter ramchanderi]
MFYNICIVTRAYSEQWKTDCPFPSYETTRELLTKPCVGYALMLLEGMPRHLKTNLNPEKQPETLICSWLLFYFYFRLNYK